MQDYIVIGMTGQRALEVINGNFTELYGAIATPTKLPGESANFSTVFPPNTKLKNLSMVALVNTPTIRVGTSPNGQELVPDTVIDQDTDFDISYYCKVQTTVYFTFSSGPGAINARIEAIPNYY